MAITIAEKMRSVRNATGFDYLRIILAVAILAWHSIWISTGSATLDAALWQGSFRFIPASLIPVFFALSGFLVAGSMERNRMHQFMTLRVIRIVPALAVEITLSALTIGLIFTDLPKSEYLTDRHFYAYFLNIIGLIHYELPGVFEHNAVPKLINAQLWTIPYELECYATLMVLSVITLLKKRSVFVALIIIACLAATVKVFFFAPLTPYAHVPGRVLVLSFLAAVSLYLYRDKVPYSNPLGWASLIASIVCLEIPDASYLAAFPIAYMTVWLGLKRPPAIPFGDLSYGVYLFHFPVEQTVMHLFPSIHAWWQLTLIALPVTGICALLSWNIIEQPILSRKKRILAKVDKLWEKWQVILEPGKGEGSEPEMAASTE